MTTLGLIGAGHIGSALARAALEQGWDVVLSNSRGPETLTDLVAELGPNARAATATEAAEAADLAVVTIPTRNIEAVPVEPLAGKVVIDTNNYYPQRDGQIAELDDESSTVSELLQRHLPSSKIVKAFNHIAARDISADAQPTGSDNRRALAIAGDDADAKATVAELIDTIGFDVVDAGALSEGCATSGTLRRTLRASTRRRCARSWARPSVTGTCDQPIDLASLVATGVEVDTTGERLPTQDIGTVRLGPTSAKFC